MTSKITEPTETVEIVGDTLVAAHKRAESLGLTLSEYVQTVLTRDMQTEKKDPWREPVPRHVSERWEREIAEFDEQEKINPQPGARTADELIQQLDEEAARLPEYEDN